MEGLCLEFPYSEEYFLLAGKLSLMQNNEKKALFYLNKATEIAASAEALSLRDMIINHQVPKNFKNVQK